MCNRSALNRDLYAASKALCQLLARNTQSAFAQIDSSFNCCFSRGIRAMDRRAYFGFYGRTLSADCLIATPGAHTMPMCADVNEVLYSIIRMSARSICANFMPFAVYFPIKFNASVPAAISYRITNHLSVFLLPSTLSLRPLRAIL